jgi:hemerythrin-like domain-containing protein
MKRSEALAALSRDHHHALDAARRLRRADAGAVDAAVAHFHEFWRQDGRRHFEIEEELILPALPQADADWRAAVERVHDEHRRIRAAASELGGEDVAAAHALGELLHDHVRFEERHLFALLEARLPEDELSALGDAVERAHG